MGHFIGTNHGRERARDKALHRGVDLIRGKVIICKSFHHNMDSNSIYFGNDRRTASDPDEWLPQHGFRHVFLVGLATDSCVAWSAEDIVPLGYEVVVVENACRGIGVTLGVTRTKLDEASDRLERLGVRSATSDDLIA
jgi:nicotinamidase/pyrazinamidase